MDNYTEGYAAGWEALARWLVRWMKLDIAPDELGDVLILKESIERVLKEEKVND